MSSWVYVVYKLVKIAVYPLTWILVLLSLALWWSRTHPGRTRGCVAAALVLTYGLSTAPVSRFLAWTLEHRYAAPPSAPTAKAPAFDAVVVLAGGVWRKGGLRAQDRLAPFSLQRLLCGRELMHQKVAPTLVLSGGNAHAFRTEVPEATIMAAVLRSIERPRWTVRTETISRTTYENAVETRRLLGNSRRIALVTSAIHMPRAMAMFTRQGFQATAYPCEFFAGAGDADVTAYLPDVDHFRLSSMAIHEWVGLGLYRLAGKAD